MAATTECMLLAIPPELRNRIYDEVLISSYKIGLTNTEEERTWRCPALLQTCTQIRREAAGIYYSRNTFVISHHSGRFPASQDAHETSCGRDVVGWCQTIGQAVASMLRKLFLDDTCHDNDEEAKLALARYRTVLAAAAVPFTECLLFIERDSAEWDLGAQWLGSVGSLEPHWCRREAEAQAATD